MDSKSSPKNDLSELHYVFDLDTHGRVDQFGNRFSLPGEAAISEALERSAAVVEMSRGVIHEISNPLTVVQARAFLLSQMLESDQIDPQKLKQSIEGITSAAEKISRILLSMRTFSRDASEDPFDLVPVLTLINDSLDFCRTRFFNHGITVDIEIVDEDLEIECRKVQISQVILSLIKDSFVAIQENEKKWLLIQVEKTNDLVQIKISDCGTPKEVPGTENKISPEMVLLGKGLADHQAQLLFEKTSTQRTAILRLPLELQKNATKTDPHKW